MKKKIGEIYNKPIVVGNKNEITKNEVHIDNLGGSTSGEGGGSASSWRYYDYTKCSTEQLSNTLYFFGMMVKIAYTGRIEIFGSLRIRNDFDEILAFAVDASQYLMQGSEKRLVSDFISMIEQEFGKLPEITEEEFYNLDVPE
jgi:hypothetical protein